jgi:hypothetical protein
MITIGGQTELKQLIGNTYTRPNREPLAGE